MEIAASFLNFISILQHLGDVSAGMNAFCILRSRTAQDLLLRLGPALCYVRAAPKGKVHAVDLALRLDVLAVLAVFAFVAAILLGAF